MKPSHLHAVALYPETHRALVRASYRPDGPPIEAAMAERVARALAVLEEQERQEAASGERYSITPPTMEERVAAIVEDYRPQIDAAKEKLREMAQGTAPTLPPTQHADPPAWKAREVERGERPEGGEWPWVRDPWWEGRP